MVILKQSTDDLIRKAGIETRTGRKWSASQTVAQAESRLRQEDIVGTTVVGKQGLGTTKPRRLSSADGPEKGKMVVEEVRKMEEEQRKTKAVAMGVQGSWTIWSTIERKLTWADIWIYEPFRLSFLLRSVNDLLQSPANLHRWGLLDYHMCHLCDRVGTMEHTLSACTTSLTQGR